MNCKRTKLEISLWVTDDLKDSSVSNLEEHLARCPDCESFRRSLQESLSGLKTGTSISKMDLNDSIWPDIESELPDYHEMQKRTRFNGWMVATAFTVACAAMVTFSNQQNFFSWSEDGAYEIDGKLFSPATDRVEGLRGFNRVSETDLQSPIPTNNSPKQDKKRSEDPNNNLEDNAEPNRQFPETND